MYQNTSIGLHTLAFSFATLVIFTACSSGDRAEGAQSRDENKTVAVVSGEPISMAELQAEIEHELRELEYRQQSEQRDLMDRALNGLVRRKLLELEAQERGITLEQLIAEETGVVSAVTDDEVRTFYEQNEAALEGQTLELLSPQIRDYLRRRQQEQILRRLAQERLAKTETSTLLDPVRAAIRTAASPSFGREDASVTLIEFSDFECPYCGRFFDTLNQIKQNYGDRIRIVYMQFPLMELHPNAWKAAEASICADEQGSFWEMHDLMFTEQDRLGVDDLKEKAGRLGLDRSAFDACLDSGRSADRVRDDIREGEIFGVTGTPALFVNGVALPGGAAPYEAVAGVIEGELRRVEEGR